MLDEVLDSARFPDRRCPDTVSEHIEKCPSCRMETERLRRAAQVWTPLQLGRADMLRLRLRTLKALRRPRRSARQWRGIGLAVVGVLIIGGGAFAAGLSIRTTQGGDTLTWPAAVAQTQPAQTRDGQHQRAAEVFEASEPELELEAVAPSLEPSPAPPSDSLAAMPARETDQDKRQQPRREAGERQTASQREAPRWLEAATAMRDHDAPRAEVALRALESSEDPITRDAASLALAELWIKGGQVTRARPLLVRLSASGATPLIRRRAAALLP
jgi:hypothetical protein